MAISEAARRNHDELFPGRISTLAQTDPGLIERFDNSRRGAAEAARSGLRAGHPSSAALRFAITPTVQRARAAAARGRPHPLINVTVTGSR
jgi:hypothetical protein